MQNDQVFEAEADMENVERNLDSLGQEELGKRSITIATGGIEAYRRESGSSEESPLLGEGISPDSNNGGDASEEWPGQKDFAGLPWWKIPSVYS